MTHHDATASDHDGGLEDEAADFVYPVDHGKGTVEEPVTTENNGDYVTHDGEPEGLDDEAADFVHPVDHGAGTVEEPAATESKGGYVSPTNQD